ncbi:hypothetical protein VN24_08640 [Paenibacillus beijingensis]|uniref:Uncharacterized protein n=1 Tax=Paenibacillus beijingensis TaxID=1126833 RepID=A0A0D5NI50_9BACL|nr:hypothetical protein VN24_08640 [Paenibacillus beijingensis]
MRSASAQPLQKAKNEPIKGLSLAGSFVFIALHEEVIVEKDAFAHLFSFYFSTSLKFLRICFFCRPHLPFRR